MTRQLLYTHLDTLEKAGIVTGSLERSGEGRAMKCWELAPFELRVTATTIAGALRQDKDSSNDMKSGDGDRDTEDTEGGR